MNDEADAEEREGEPSWQAPRLNDENARKVEVTQQSSAERKEIKANSSRIWSGFNAGGSSWVLRVRTERRFEEQGRHCRKRLAPFKLPTLWRQTDSFPFNPTETIYKFMLTDWARGSTAGSRGAL